MRNWRQWPWWFVVATLTGWPFLAFLTIYYPFTHWLQSEMFQVYHLVIKPVPRWLHPDLHMHVLAGLYISWWCLTVAAIHRRYEGWAPVWLAVVVALVIVSAEECLQLLRPDRTGSWLDWSASFSGVVYGFLLWHWGKRWRHKIRGRMPEQSTAAESA